MATTKKFKFSIGQHVKYIGEDSSLKGKEYLVETREVLQQLFKKDDVIYGLSQKDKPSVKIRVLEKVLKVAIANPAGKKFIKSIDERAKVIQKASGIKRTEKVVFYNISRSEAKEKAFKEAKK